LSSFAIQAFNLSFEFFDGCGFGCLSHKTSKRLGFGSG
jgi:hypothetical protein